MIAATPVDLEYIKTSDVLPRFRERLVTYASNHSTLDYVGMFVVTRNRALALWHKYIVPDLNVTAQRQFERELAKVGMRAGLAIPTVFANGYVYGSACHALAGGDPKLREEAAATCGLYLFILGLFDHLFDEFPDQLSSVGSLFDRENLERWMLERRLDGVEENGNILAAGLLRLYRVYFKRCHALLDKNPDKSLANIWYEVLCAMHAGERDSAQRRISTVAPNPDLMKKTRKLTADGYWGLALSACLAGNEKTASSAREFSGVWSHLAWLTDDVTDLDRDARSDIWSGLLIRFALESKSGEDVDSVTQRVADEAGDLLGRIYASTGHLRWQSNDDFTLADLFWADIWSWLGGISAPVSVQQLKVAVRKIK